MKANELRIGNLLNSSIYSHIHTRVEGILYDEIITNCTDAEDTMTLSPIPLTEEWLVRLGFVNVGGSDYAKDVTEKNSGSDKSMIYVDGGEDNETFEFTILILTGSGDWIRTKNKHVHSLQNLYFALTGEELELK